MDIPVTGAEKEGSVFQPWRKIFAFPCFKIDLVYILRSSELQMIAIQTASIVDILISRKRRRKICGIRC